MEEKKWFALQRRALRVTYSARKLKKAAGK
jgi:hypothetical protein